MATAYDIVVGALQLCKAYAVGEPPSAAIGQVGLRSLNNMRAQWSADGVACFGLQELTIAANGSSEYTIGTGGDIAGRVIGIRSVTVVDGENVYAPIQLSLDEFREIGGADTGFPQYWAVKQGAPYSVYLWPAPAVGTVKFMARTPFAEIANLSDVIPDPPEYLEVMEAALAMRLADRFGSDAGTSTAAIAANGYAALKERASPCPPPILKLDSMLVDSVDLDHDTERRAG